MHALTTHLFVLIWPDTSHDSTGLCKAAVGGDQSEHFCAAQQNILAHGGSSAAADSATHQGGFFQIIQLFTHPAFLDENTKFLSGLLHHNVSAPVNVLRPSKLLAIKVASA